MTPAFRAAVDVAAKYGIRADDPLLLQETNNTVVWLRPSEVIAKVGTHADSLDELRREYEVARALAALGAPVASPLAESPPTTDPTTGFIVTLWNRLERDGSTELPASAVGESLGQLHEALDDCRVDLPDFRVDIRRSRRILEARSRIPALAADDRALLEEVFDALLPTIEGAAFDSRPLHGEPHEGNRVLTPLGIRWLDFETACRGPVEWDLAFLPEGARANFSTIDEDLLAVLSSLNSARVATWCSVQARFAVMRRHAQHHLDLLRRGWPA
ncbi:MAG TPA: aminoglycoside phosphotransferase family protein [Acidimicrobiales bacterium]|nr:aminoglycoside phosphotransferase family protein [Acidimicrobiales bacterium]